MPHRLLKYTLLLFLVLIIVYAALWFFSMGAYQQAYGVSFRPQYADSLGLDWQKTYTDILIDLKPKYVRVAAEWAEIEPVRGQYDFANLDWMMSEADKNGVKIILAVGQKTPRWPECHNPEWVRPMSASANEHLLNYIQAVVERYKVSSAFFAWQVENEPFIPFVFGMCADFHPEWVTDEVVLVKRLDAKHPIIMTDSGELGSWVQASKSSDILGTTMYRRVVTPHGMLWSYAWLPPSAYSIHAKLVGKDSNFFIISELQAEPWYTDANALTMPIADQVKQFSPDDLRGNIAYANHVNASQVYLWGVEWWYFMKEKQDDARYWEVAKDAMAQSL